MHRILIVLALGVCELVCDCRLVNVDAAAVSLQETSSISTTGSTTAAAMAITAITTINSTSENPAAQGAAVTGEVGRLDGKRVAYTRTSP